MTESEAIDIAAKHAEQQGWTWLERVSCKRSGLSNSVFVIRTNAGSRGCQIVMTIDAVEATVREARFLRR